MADSFRDNVNVYSIGNNYMPTPGRYIMPCGEGHYDIRYQSSA
jgi:hypothetical protein